jgi:L-ascorbate metabolism protein UlaG (beta-lactamase superfamily)
MEGINWLGHSGFKIKGEKIIYIDPFNISNSDEKADIILITHEHYDHCSIKDIMKLSMPKTTILITPDCQSKLSDFPGKVGLVEPNRQYVVQGIKIETVPAYNIGKRYHMKDNSWVGYIVTVNGKRIYHAGDTDIIPEMNSIKNIDVAMLPVCGSMIMTASEAAKAAEIIKPKVAVPMHYGAILGSRADAEKFKSLWKGTVEIMEKA